MEPRNSTKNSSGLFLAASELVLYSCGTDNAENAVLLLHSADHTETSHVIAEYCWSVMLLRLCGNIFTKPLPGSGLHNPVVSILMRVLLRNGCFRGSTILAWGKYVTLY
jgi:hypothetical protein